MEGLANLKMPFRENGNVTATNASGLNDGDCPVILMSEEKAPDLDLKAKMRWVASAVAVVPTITGISPVPAIRKVWKRPG